MTSAEVFPYARRLFNVSSRLFHKLGVRCMSLTHGFNTPWADSSGTGRPVPPRYDGLSPFGVEVVKEMNRLGMLADVSHVADTTFFHTLEVSESPVIASHSSVDGVRGHPRNLSDDMLRALAENGGVIHINAVIKHIGKLGNVTYEFVKRGYDEGTIRKVLGGNTLRVMDEVEAVARRKRLAK